MRVVLNRYAAAVVVVSDALKADYESAGGIDRTKLRTVHNGIDIDRFATDAAEGRECLATELAIPREAPVVVSVSVLRDGKGIDVLLAAARRVVENVPDVRFVIVGDGEKREEWTALATGLGLDGHVVWAGYRRDIERFLAGCDLFAHPTFADALPTVLMEAMAAGLPVVASSVGGIPEIVEEGRTGRLVPPGDAGGLADAITALLNEPETMRRMCSEAVERAWKHFSTEAWTERLAALYETAAPGAPA